MRLSKFFPVLLLLATSVSAIGQSLRDINFIYQYNAGEPFVFILKPVREAQQWNIYYEFRLQDTSLSINDFAIHWEARESLSEKENNSAITFSSMAEPRPMPSGFFGTARLDVNQAPEILVAKVVHIPQKRAWVFYKVLDPNYPVNGQVFKGERLVTSNYVNIGDSVRLSGKGLWVVSYYDNNFPTALPPFSEALGRVSQGIKPDSTFSLVGGESTAFTKTGLYLVQKDTTAVEGFTFRVEADYPKLATIPSLAGPLVYICTKQEYDRLVQAKNDKRAFDRVVLNITHNTGRAKQLMRTFFRRVEVANQYFTTYKEGWKSDRGMIFIIFGMPNEVYRFSDREVWTYDNNVNKVTFSFAKTSSVFDPENYVLIRDNKHRDLWYEMIDLWRNARF